MNVSERTPESDAAAAQLLTLMAAALERISQVKKTEQLAARSWWWQRKRLLQSATALRVQVIQLVANAEALMTTTFDMRPSEAREHVVYGAATVAMNAAKGAEQDMTARGFKLVANVAQERIRYCRESLGELGFSPAEITQALDQLPDRLRE